MLVCSPSLKVLMTPSTSECPRVDTFEAEHVEVALFVLKFEERIIRPKIPTHSLLRNNWTDHATLVVVSSFLLLQASRLQRMSVSPYPMICFYGKYA